VDEQHIPAGRRIFGVVIADAVDRREMIPGRLSDYLPFGYFIDKQTAAKECRAKEHASNQIKAFSGSSHPVISF
jgi:hypothetical protein